MDVWFYHLQTQSLDTALPKIVEKAVDRGWRVVVQTVDDLRMKSVDDMLWAYHPESFLAHSTERDPSPERQSVLVTLDGNATHRADVWIYLDGAPFDLASNADCARVVVMFDGHNDAEVATARQTWANLKSQGISLAYWQQDDHGRWDRRM